MNFLDKLTKATLVASYLVDTSTPLKDELEDRGLAELVGDAEFERLVGDRAYQCADCGEWLPIKEWIGTSRPSAYPKYCGECAAVRRRPWHRA